VSKCRSIQRLLRKQLGVALVEWSGNIKISDQAPPGYWPVRVQPKKTTSGLTDERLARQVHWPRDRPDILAVLLQQLPVIPGSSTTMSRSGLPTTSPPTSGFSC
jgi:hypothetical protein